MSLTREQIQIYRDLMKENSPLLSTEADALCDMALRSLDAPPSATVAHVRAECSVCGSYGRTDAYAAHCDRSDCPTKAKSLKGESPLELAGRIISRAESVGDYTSNALILAKALMLAAAPAASPQQEPHAGVWRWIDDAVKALKMVDAAPPAFVKLCDELLQGVPCPQEDLGFDSPADRAARLTRTEGGRHWKRGDLRTDSKYINACPGRPVWFVSGDGQVWIYDLPELPSPLSQSQPLSEPK